MRQKIRTLIRFNLLSLLMVIAFICFFSIRVVSSEVTMDELKQRYPKVIYDLNVKIVEAHERNQVRQSDPMRRYREHRNRMLTAINR